MSDNYGTGFPGFQSRMQAMIDACGGDELARRMIQDEFCRELRRRVEEHEKHTEFLVNLYMRHHMDLFAWATDHDFDGAALECERMYERPDLDEVSVYVNEPFVVTNRGAIWRRHGDRALLLAWTSEAGSLFVSLDDAVCDWLEVVDMKQAKSMTTVKSMDGAIKRCRKLVDTVLIPAREGGRRSEGLNAGGY